MLVQPTFQGSICDSWNENKPRTCGWSKKPNLKLWCLFKSPSTSDNKNPYLRIPSSTRGDQKKRNRRFVCGPLVWEEKKQGNIKDKTWLQADKEKFWKNNAASEQTGKCGMSRFDTAASFYSWIYLNQARWGFYVLPASRWKQNSVWLKKYNFQSQMRLKWQSFDTGVINSAQYWKNVYYEQGSKNALNMKVQN